MLDFGIAKSVHSEETKVGTLKGKPAYLSPEQAQGKPIDHRSDLYAVSVILWEAVAGQRICSGKKDQLEVLQELLNAEAPSVRETKPDVPNALAALCERAVAIEVNDRFCDAEEFRRALEAYLEVFEANVTGRKLVSGLRVCLALSGRQLPTW